jgi:hypothetical protein
LYAKLVNKGERDMSKFVIVTTFIEPPIPVRDFDWSAILDNYNGDPNCPKGWGSTEAEAVQDLMDCIEMLDEEIISKIKNSYK